MVVLEVGGTLREASVFLNSGGTFEVFVNHPTGKIYQHDLLSQFVLSNPLQALLWGY